MLWIFDLRWAVWLKAEMSSYINLARVYFKEQQSLDIKLRFCDEWRIIAGELAWRHHGALSSLEIRDDHWLENLGAWSFLWIQWCQNKSFFYQKRPLTSRVLHSSKIGEHLNPSLLVPFTEYPGKSAEWVYTVTRFSRAKQSRNSNVSGMLSQGEEVLLPRVT